MALVKKGYRRVFGILAVAAAQNGIGERVEHQGSICRDVPLGALPTVKRAATRLSDRVRNGPRKAPSPPGVFLTMTTRGTPRKRLVSDAPAANKVIADLLRSADGQMTTDNILKVVRGHGIGATSRTVAVMRGKMGYPRSSYKARVVTANGNGFGHGGYDKPETPDTVVYPVSKAVEVAWDSSLPEVKTLPITYLKSCVKEWELRLAAARAILDEA